MERLFFNSCIVHVNPGNGIVQTCFDDDTTAVVEKPLENQFLFLSAKELGYTNIEEFNIHNQVLHTYLWELIKQPYSETLWNIAHEIEKETFLENAVVISTQNYIVNGIQEPLLINFLDIHHLKLRSIKKELIKVLDI